MERTGSIFVHLYITIEANILLKETDPKKTNQSNS
jgi:hypothetical protein